MAEPDAFFLNAGATGQRFCLYHAPAGSQCLGKVLYVHPFAEEMNKARRMAALQSRALADAGFAVLQIDLHGCGDSAGDFGDASWSSWLEDVALGVAWLQQQPAAPLWLWGLRGGCLLAAEAVQRYGWDANFLFWQAAAAGKPLLQQFMRLRLAAELAGGQGKGLMAQMQAELAAGRAVEIAGYQLAPGVAQGLEQAKLQPPSRPSRLEWLDVSGRADGSLSPVSADCLQRWQASGHQARGQAVAGPAFWQSTEIELAAELLSQTVSAVCA